MATIDRFRAGKRLWNPKDDAQLRHCYPQEPTAAIAVRLRRSLPATYNRARLLGLAKSAAYLVSPHACRLRRGDHVGAAFRYPKGHVPANKGLRRPGWARGRMKETQFTPGVLAGAAAQRFKPIGSLRIADGYVYRKISAVPGPWTVNWKQEHRLIWTAAHGPIPPGYCLVFKNSNPLDVRLDNLDLIPRRELMLRNTIHHKHLKGSLNNKAWALANWTPARAAKPRHDVGDAHTIVPPKREPTSSWWLNLDRSAFQEELRRRHR